MSQSSLLSPTQYTEFFSWGNDAQGQLGHGQTRDQTQRRLFLPKSLSFDVVITRISCGSSHTAFLTEKGQVFTFGDNSFGQLGVQKMQQSNQPLLVQQLNQAQITSVACGGQHTGAVSIHGDVYLWGRNQEGQCGTPIQKKPKVEQPSKVNIGDVKVKELDLGDLHSTFLTRDQILMTCGDNSRGQCGLGDQSEIFICEPRLVFQIEEPVIQTSAGYRHTLVVTKQGNVYGCGSNRKNEMGKGENSFQDFYSPVRLENLTDVQQVAAGSLNAALTRSGSVVVWGMSEFGSFTEPHRVQHETRFKQVAVQKQHENPFAAAIDEKGQLYSWGSNNHGQLGQGDFDMKTLPTLVTQLKKKKVSQLALGLGFVVALGSTIGYNTNTIERKQSAKAMIPKSVSEKRDNPVPLVYTRQSAPLRVTSPDNSSYLIKANQSIQSDVTNRTKSSDNKPTNRRQPETKMIAPLPQRQQTASQIIHQHDQFQPPISLSQTQNQIRIYSPINDDEYFSYQKPPYSNSNIIQNQSSTDFLQQLNLTKKQDQSFANLNQSLLQQLEESQKQAQQLQLQISKLLQEKAEQYQNQYSIIQSQNDKVNHLQTRVQELITENNGNEHKFKTEIAQLKRQMEQQHSLLTNEKALQKQDAENLLKTLQDQQQQMQSDFAHNVQELIADHQKQMREMAHNHQHDQQSMREEIQIGIEKIRELQHEIQEKDGYCNKLAQQRKEIEEELISVSEEIDQHVQNYEELELKYVNLQHHSQTVESERNKLQKDQIVQDSEILKLTRKTNELEQSLFKSQTEKEDLSRQIQQYKEIIESKEEQINSYQSDLFQIRQEQSSMQQEVHRYYETAQQRTQLQEETLSKFNTAQQELDKKNRELTQIMQEYASLKDIAEIEKRKQLINEQKLEQAQSEIFRLTQKQEASQEQVQQLNQECAQQQQMIKDMKTTFDKKAQEYEQKQHNLQNQSESSRTELHHLSDHLQSKSNEISKLSEIIAQQRTQLEYYQNDQYKQEQNIQQMEIKNQSLMKLLETQIQANERRKQASLEYPSVIKPTISTPSNQLHQESTSSKKHSRAFSHENQYTTQSFSLVSKRQSPSNRPPLQQVDLQLLSPSNQQSLQTQAKYEPHSQLNPTVKAVELKQHLNQDLQPVQSLPTSNRSNQPTHESLCRELRDARSRILEMQQR